MTTDSALSTPAIDANWEDVASGLLARLIDLEESMSLALGGDERRVSALAPFWLKHVQAAISHATQ